jgi:hypothetical protein
MSEYFTTQTLLLIYCAFVDLNNIMWSPYCKDSDSVTKNIWVYLQYIHVMQLWQRGIRAKPFPLVSLNCSLMELHVKNYTKALKIRYWNTHIFYII